MRNALFLVLMIGSLTVSGQHVLDVKLDGSEQGQVLTDFLHHIEQQHHARIFFVHEWFDQTRIHESYKGVTLRDALTDILRGTDINYIPFYNYGIIFSRDPAGALERETIIRNARAGNGKVEKIVLGDPAKYQLGKTVQIAGKVIDNKNKEGIGGARVLVSDLNIQTSTAPDGTFHLTIPAGEHAILFSYLNYEEKVIDISTFEDGEVRVDILEQPRMLEEVTVSDQHINTVTGRIGQTNLRMADIKKMPTFLGEVDVIKQIQVLPGVTSVGEVSSGFNVRGGSVDQNLILYDGLPVFNTSHVFGFFSTFNSEAIKDASFYKGGIPAEYGGRASSVLSVNSKEGNNEKWEANGGIGLVSSNLSVGGPIKKNASSAQVSVRSSYSDWMLATLGTNYKNIKNSSVSFYDVSVKLTHKFNANNKISFSGYTSKDHFGLPSDTTFIWQNNLASLRFDHIFNEKAFSSILAGFGQYQYQVTDADPNTAYDMRYKINYPTLKADFNYHSGKHKLMLGLNSAYYAINPGSIRKASAISDVISKTMDQNQSFENALFISDGIDVSERFHIDAGFRISLFSSLGAATVYLYQPGKPLNDSTALGTVKYGSGAIIRNYIGPEPRLALRYNVGQNGSLKLGYNRMYQYIHLVSNTVAVTPIDIYQPSNTFFRPQMADQVSLGYFRNAQENKFEFSVEAFYKKINNILEFKDNASLVLNPTLERALLQGTARSYGIEFSATKVLGRLTGGLNYTYSRSFRHVDMGPAEEQKVSKGREYPSNFDQPNIVNLNWKYGISRRIYFTGNFTYRTGRPVTVPYSYSVIDHTQVVNFSERNQYRLPDYHRLDVAIVLEGSHRRKKFWDGSWVLSLYNVYARKNAYTLFYQRNGIGVQQAYQMSIVGTVLPSLSYRFKF